MPRDFEHHLPCGIHHFFVGGDGFRQGMINGFIDAYDLFHTCRGVNSVFLSLTTLAWKLCTRKPSDLR